MASDQQAAKSTEGRNRAVRDGYLPVNELLGEYQGANSPFGDDLVFPLPVTQLEYTHPGTVPVSDA